MVEVNSLEWYTIITTVKEPSEQFAQFTVVAPNVFQLKDGRQFRLNDDEPNRRRPLEELLCNQ